MHLNPSSAVITSIEIACYPHFGSTFVILIKVHFLSLVFSLFSSSMPLLLLLRLIRPSILIMPMYIYRLVNWRKLITIIGHQTLNYGLKVRVMLIILPKVWPLLLKMMFPIIED